MRTRLVLALVVGVAVLGSAAGGDTGAAAGKATLRLMRGAPLALRGTHFAAGERVRVTVSAEQRVVKSVLADGQGSFLVRFQTGYDRCLGMTAVAVGNHGSRARLKTPELLCPPRL